MLPVSQRDHGASCSEDQAGQTQNTPGARSACHCFLGARRRVDNAQGDLGP